MSDNSSSNKRIAKNTLLLYVRMFFMMGISLYTSRVILAELGVEDYGIYNVVGSVVAMFTFISSAMGNSTSRFITFTLGNGTDEELTKVYNTAVAIHALLSFLIFFVAETIGLWFLNSHMTIPRGRLFAANWAYQFSILSTIVTIMNVPLRAVIISHERMSAFAYLSVLDAILKLLIIFLLVVFPIDKLISYSGLIQIIVLLDLFMYWIYCRKNFKETRIKLLYDKSLFVKMLGFAGWSLIGNVIWIGYTQGLNILLNLFCGPAVNAARGIAVQVQGTVNGFVTNFQTAINPQITKSYATSDYDRLKKLIFLSSKFSFILLLCLVLPIAIEAQNILNIWLVETPEHATAFVQLTLLMLLFSPLENPIATSNDATGNIKKYQITVGCFNIFIIINGYLMLKFGLAPEWIFVSQFMIVSIVQIVKVYLVHKKINLSFVGYMKEIYLRVWITALFAGIFPFIISRYFTNEITEIVCVSILSFLSVLISGYVICLNNVEREMITSFIKKVINKHKM